jgi:hypothetical protein
MTLFVFNSSLSENGPSSHIMNDIFFNYSASFQCIAIQRSKKIKFDKSKFNFLFANIPFKRSGISLLRVLFDQFFFIVVIFITFFIKSKIDKVFIQSNPIPFLLIVFFKLKKVKIIYNLQDLFPNNLLEFKKNSFILGFIKKINFYSYKLCNKIITISNDMKKTLVDCHIEKDRIHVVYNWNTITNSNIAYSKKNLGDSKKQIVYGGNLGFFQNPLNISKLAYFLPNYEFVVYGSGTQRNILLNFIKKYKLTNIKVFKQITQKRIIEVYRNADINLVSLNNNLLKYAMPSKFSFLYSLPVKILFITDNYITLSQTIGFDQSVYFLDINDFSKQKESLIEFIENDNLHFNRTAFINNFLDKEKNIDEYIKIINYV